VWKGVRGRFGTADDDGADDKRPLDLVKKDVYSSCTPGSSALVEYEIFNQDYRMKNVDKWEPSKAIQDSDGNWVVNRKGVGRGSKHVASLQIPAYAKVIAKYAKGSLLDCGAGKVPFYGVYKELVSDITCTDWGSSPHNLQHLDKEVDLSKKTNLQRFLVCSRCKKSLVAIIGAPHFSGKTTKYILKLG
jgi:hypothetical protein